MLQPFPYDVLWNHSEKFTRNVDLREGLVFELPPTIRLAGLFFLGYTWA